MMTGKTEAVSVRVEPKIKAALLAAAEHERRSIANMVEVMVLTFCRERGIEIPDLQVVVQEPHHTDKSNKSRAAQNKSK
jgi:hypothetical protein